MNTKRTFIKSVAAVAMALTMGSAFAADITGAGSNRWLIDMFGVEQPVGLAQETGFIGQQSGVQDLHRDFASELFVASAIDDACPAAAEQRPVRRVDDGVQPPRPADHVGHGGSALAHLAEVGDDRVPGACLVLGQSAVTLLAIG